MAKNKVEFGISQLHIGTYSVSDNDIVSLGPPYHQRGAVSFAPEEQSELSTFFADNQDYWDEYSGGTQEGDLVVAKYDDEFKTRFLGYKALASGGIGKPKNAIKPKVYIAFQVEGDAEARRVIFYNATLGAITREYTTIEETKTVNTESIPVTASGDVNTGVPMEVLKPGDAGYDVLFTNPIVPSFSDESE